MKTAVALGTFDGVHAGHKAVLSAAANSGLRSIAVAFRIPPKIFSLNEGIIITDEPLKTRLIKETGIKEIDYLDFEKVKDLSAEDFFFSLKKTYNPQLIVCGYNYTFGKGGKGNVKLLRELCNKSDIALKVIDSVCAGDIPISSTYIRELLKNGNIKEANRLLPTAFSVTASVIHGERRGRKMDFPTFNQRYPLNMQAVKRGVYFTSTVIDGKTYFGMTNIGYRPTFPLDYTICETHLFDFRGDLYDKTLTLTLIDFIREEKHFASLNELKASIEKDKEAILKLMKEV